MLVFHVEDEEKSEDEEESEKNEKKIMPVKEMRQLTAEVHVYDV